MTDLSERRIDDRASTPGPVAPPLPPESSAGETAESQQPRRYGTLAGTASLVIAGTGLVLVGAHAIGIPTPPCPLRATTGFPCPFCGLTHVAREVLTGHIGVVVRNDPAGLVLAVLLGIAVALQVLAMIRRSDGPALLRSRVVAGMVGAVLAAHWGTTIVTGGMFTA